MAGVYMYIDASELDGLISSMREKLTPPEFDRLMNRTLNEVGRRMKTPIKKAVREQYSAPAGFVSEGIKSPRIESSGGGMTCIIPLIGPKGNIGSTFVASGGWHGWNPPKYRITVSILKGQRSTLPETLPHQGGQPPFRNTGSKIAGVVMTRKGKDRLPIERVSALALPQMPMNRAEPEVERAALDLLEKRVVHNFSHMFGGG